MSRNGYNDEQNSHLKGNLNNFGHIPFCTSINIGGVLVLEANAMSSYEKPQEGDTDLLFFLPFFFSHLGMRFKEMFCNCSRS